MLNKQNATVIVYRLRIDIPTSDCTVKSHDCGNRTIYLFC